MSRDSDNFPHVVVIGLNFKSSPKLQSPWKTCFLFALSSASMENVRGECLSPDAQGKMESKSS